MRNHTKKKIDWVTKLTAICLRVSACTVMSFSLSLLNIRNVHLAQTFSKSSNVFAEFNVLTPTGLETIEYMILLTAKKHLLLEQLKRLILGLRGGGYQVVITAPCIFKLHIFPRGFFGIASVYLWVSHFATFGDKSSKKMFIHHEFTNKLPNCLGEYHTP